MLTGLPPCFMRNPEFLTRKKAETTIGNQLLSTFSKVRECFSEITPSKVLKHSSDTRFVRNRIYSLEVTFWGFFMQVMNSDLGCREVVRNIQAAAAASGTPIPNSSTSAWCQARAKLDPKMLKSLHQHTVVELESYGQSDALQGRRVIVFDGTGLSMPDTAQNQEVWPQSATQAPGCGFPTLRLLAAFDLRSGSLIDYCVGNKHDAEGNLLDQMPHVMREGDIFLGDKGFSTYYDIATACQRGYDQVVPVDARRGPVSASDAIKVLGEGDLLIRWSKTKWVKALRYDKEASEQLPDELILRQIHVKIAVPGFRKESFYLVTTLLDPLAYPADELATLYFQRWNVELFFRDLKTTMGMDILRCQSPDMVRKEIQVFAIVYNCIRWLMLTAAKRKKVAVRLVSFKAAIQAIRSWIPLLMQVSNHAERRRLWHSLVDAIADALLFIRPWRSEPRRLKRRSKPFKNLTKPRHDLMDAIIIGVEPA